MDSKVTIKDLKEQARGFTQPRLEAKIFRNHDAKELALNLMTEVAEFAELFRFIEKEKVRERFESKRVEAEDELADVLLSVLLICNDYEVDLSDAFARKMESSALKYPLGPRERS